jgi:hypothetical protein
MSSTGTTSFLKRTESARQGEATDLVWSCIKSPKVGQWVSRFYYTSSHSDYSRRIKVTAVAIVLSRVVAGAWAALRILSDTTDAEPQLRCRRESTTIDGDQSYYFIRTCQILRSAIARGHASFKRATGKHGYRSSGHQVDCRRRQK